MFSRAGSFTDPDADSWSATVDYGDGAGAVPLSLAADKSFQLSHSYLDNGSYTVTVSVDDGHERQRRFPGDGRQCGAVRAGGTGRHYRRRRHAFAAGLVQRPGQSRQLDRHRRLRRRLGHPAAAAPGLDHSFQLLHTYTSAGQFTLTVTVSDDDGGAGSDTVTVTVEAAPTFTLMVAAAGSGAGR